MDFVNELDTKIASLAQDLGAPVDGLKMLLCLFLEMPLAYFYRFLPSEASRHWFSIVLSTVLGLFAFRIGVIHILIFAIFPYMVMKVAARGQVGMIVFVVLFSYLLGVHYYREFILADPNGLMWDGTLVC